MKVSHHVAISGVFSGAVYAASMSWRIALSSFVTGILIDVDHILDYLREYGFRPNLHTFFTSFTQRNYRRIMIFLHSWELIVAGAVAAWLSGWNQWIVGIVIGAGQHLVCDQFGNRLGKYAYFLSYRVYHRFLPERMFLPVAQRSEIRGQRSGKT